MDKRKIVIGTANFSMKYGLINNFTKLNRSEIKRIIKKAEKKKLNFFDTAKDYGESEKIIGQEIKKKWNIITKIPKINLNEENDIKRKIYFLVNDSVRKLKVKKLYAVLLHDEDQLLKKNQKVIFKTLLDLKKRGIIKKIGVSFYTPKKLLKVISLFKLDIVQVPINYINQSFLNKKLINKLRKKKIEIHARSIFLQGLLLTEKTKLKKFKKFIKYLDLWHKKEKISRLESCINFVLSQKYIDKYVIGFQNLKQMNEILKTKKINITNFPKYSDNFIKDPRKWID